MGKPEKILVVDDENVGRQLLEAILLPEGYEVVFGVNGEEALELTFSENPDIILCDVMMPKMDGFEVCKKLRADERSAHIPIFLITALDDRDSRIKGIDAGADDYISKPFDRLEILAKVKNHANLLKYRGQTKGAEKDEKAEHFPSAFLLESLLQTYSLDSGLKWVETVRNEKPELSRHLLTSLKSGEYTYLLLISNQLSGINAVLANILFNRFAELELSVSDLTPCNLIAKVEDHIKHRTNVDNGDEHVSPNYSVTLIRTHISDGIAHAAGINQAILISGDDKKDLNLEYLAKENDIELSAGSIGFVISNNLFEGKKEEVLHILQTSLDMPESPLEKVISSEFTQTSDFIVLRIIL